MKQRMHKLRCAPRWVAALVLVGMSVSMLTAMADQIHTYQVTDGATSVTVNSFGDDYEKIRESAGFGGDDYEITEVLDESNLLTRVTVEEKFVVTIHADGDTIYMPTVSGTVGNMLTRAGLSYDSDDKMSPSVDAEITGESEINFVRVRAERRTDNQPIAFEIEKHYNDQMTYGTTRVTQDGVDGEMQYVYDVVTEDGVEISRTLVTEEILTQPVNQIVEIGTAGAVTTRGGDVLRYSKAVDVTATAYSSEGMRNKLTAIGSTARVGAIAVDPRVIPLGSRLYITSADGTSWVYGVAVAEDTGGAIKGNRIDLYFDTQSECRSFGRRSAKVYVLS